MDSNNWTSCALYRGPLLAPVLCKCSVTFVLPGPKLQLPVLDISILHSHWSGANEVQEMGYSVAVLTGRSHSRNFRVQLDKGSVGSDAVGSAQLWLRGRAVRNSGVHVA